MNTLDTIQSLVAGLVGELEAAWNAGDARRFAAAFAEDADFIHILGGHGRGRSAIADAHRRLFATIYHNSRARFRLDDQRLVGTAVIARLEQQLTFGADGTSRTMTCRPTLVLAQRDGGCEIVLMHNTRVAESATTAPELASHPFAPRRATA